MQRPYQLVHLIVHLILSLFILSSIAFSQSGAAKSLEIGNKWVYSKVSQGRFSKYATTHEVIGDTSINGTQYAVVTNKDRRYQRADSTKVYYYSLDNEKEWAMIDFSRPEGILEQSDDWDETKKYYLEFLGENRLYLRIDSHSGSFSYFGRTYIKGIGLFSSSSSGHGNYEGSSTTLIYTEINGLVYDDFPKIKLDYQKYINSSTFDIFISSEDAWWNGPMGPYSKFNSIEYREDNDSWLNIYKMPHPENSISLLLNSGEEGEHEIEFHSIDVYGHERNKIYTFIVDYTAPQIQGPKLDIYYGENGIRVVVEGKVIDENFHKIGFSFDERTWIWNNHKEYFSRFSVTNNIRSIFLKAYDLAGNESEVVEILFEKVSSFSLGKNYPNPFNPTTQITYELPQDSKVELLVYNSLGEEIIKLVDGNQAVGRYNINWNGQNTLGNNVPGGVYFYSISTKDFTKTRKMLLLR